MPWPWTDGEPDSFPPPRGCCDGHGGHESNRRFACSGRTDGNANANGNGNGNSNSNSNSNYN